MSEISSLWTVGHIVSDVVVERDPITRVLEYSHRDHAV
jgi:hypothetical protein